ncbi:MAG: N-acetylmuramidase domain-containing protein [Gallionellaceae bacterium]|nr:N-acetylmuramidase domain-containing protein [Gallionellaceae bacterium]
MYERHYFHRLTNGKYSKKHPDISNSLSGGYGKFSAQYGKLERAFNLDPEAALKSASWGRFQIMGNNHQAATKRLATTRWCHSSWL